MQPRFRVSAWVLAVLTTVLLWSSPGAAQPVDAGAIDALVEEARRAWEVPGAALAIVRDDAVIHLKGYGVRRLGSPEPVTPDTLFAIASCTKAFTATVLAQLVDDGKLAWDDPVRKHIPFFQMADPLADRDVTLRDLLCHRTGLDRHDLLWLAAPTGREELIRKVRYLPLVRSFRSGYGYNNLLYLVAGYAAGKVAGSSWEELVQKRLFDPLGMTAANFSITATQRAPDHAVPHRPKDGKVMVLPWRNLDHIGPAGAINASARDMAKWVRFQLAGGTLAGHRLVSAAALAETHTPQTVIRLEGTERAANPETTQKSYGLGWSIQDYRGHLLVSHTGGLEGFRARVVLVPQSRLGLVLLTNSGAGMSSASMHMAATNGLVDHLLGLPRKDWNAHYGTLFRTTAQAEKAREQQRLARRKPGTKPSHELAAYTGTYEDPAYGRVRISLQDGSLACQWETLHNRLDHFHFDVFRTTGDNLLEDELLAFTLGTNGEVASLSFLGRTFPRVRSRSRRDPETPGSFPGPSQERYGAQAQTPSAAWEKIS